MATYYNYIHLVPNVQLEDKITVGFLAYDFSGNCLCFFSENHQRIQAFMGNSNLDYLHEFAERLTSLCNAGTESQEFKQFYAQSAKWQNTIQISKPHFSTLDFDQKLKILEREVA